MLGSRGTDSNENDSNTPTIVIPASFTVLASGFFENAPWVEVVKFEPGSQIRRIETGTFSQCFSLKSICIPASVEFLERSCLCADMVRRLGLNASMCMALEFSQLESLTFEPGSKLREIESGAFCGCELLQEICIPTSVQKLSAASFPRSRHCRIELEPGNRYFEMVGDFLMRLTFNSIVRYCGTGSEVGIGDEIAKIEEYCFAFCESLRSLSFGSMSHLSAIEARAFWMCQKLESIAIPSPALFLGEHCFDACTSLQTVAFCPDSRLDCINESAFSGCLSLESIILPSSLKRLGAGCFSSCPKLANSSQSIVLPPSLEFIGDDCFVGCESVSCLAFPSQSHLRELLDLPPLLARPVSIPDSVEIMVVTRPVRWSQQTLTFGPESRLSAFRTKSAEGIDCGRFFLRFSSRSLRLFRANLEFQ
jgi:hypothetical protein